MTDPSNPDPGQHRPCNECDQPGLIVYRSLWLCSQCALDAIEALRWTVDPDLLDDQAGL